MDSILIKSGTIATSSSYEIPNSGINSAVIFWYTNTGVSSMFITPYYSTFNESKDEVNIKRTTAGGNVVITAPSAITNARYFLIK